MFPCPIDTSADHFRKRFLSHRRIKKVFISDGFMFSISNYFFRFLFFLQKRDVFSRSKSLSCILKRNPIVNRLQLYFPTSAQTFQLQPELSNFFLSNFMSDFPTSRFFELPFLKRPLKNFPVNAWKTNGKLLANCGHLQNFPSNLWQTSGKLEAN